MRSIGSPFGRIGAAISAILAAATGARLGARPPVAIKAPNVGKITRNQAWLGDKRQNARARDRQHAAAKQHLAMLRTLSAEKHRGPGELAHRRWRKRRSAGRA